jgi:leucyl/phenylalanyl-tRNA--protein transferase
MPTPPPEPLSILQRYASGYFPMIDDTDPAHPLFFWDRWPIRAILPINDDTLARARRLARRPRHRFVIRYNTAVEQILRHLQRLKPRSWVRGEVLDLYRTLNAANLLRTIEAWLPPRNIAASPGGGRRRVAASGKFRLAGALLGIPLPGVFIAETMYSLVPDASKLCLCQLLQNCHAAGFDLIDVQTPHNLNSGEFDLDAPSSHPPRRKTNPPPTPHPCTRLGEQTISLHAFLQTLHAALTHHFPGTSAPNILQAWLTLAQHPTPTTTDPTNPRRFLQIPLEPNTKSYENI